MSLTRMKHGEMRHFCGFSPMARKYSIPLGSICSPPKRAGPHSTLVSATVNDDQVRLVCDASVKREQTQAQALNGQLKLEIESWRDPRRINTLARQMGLIQPAPAQVLEYSDFNGTQAESARLVRPTGAQ